MSLHTKLDAWQQAGVIDAQTRARIDAFERANERPVLLYALGGLGAVTIGIGIISIVAANWDAIDKSVKLGLDLLVGCALSVALYVAATRDRRWPTEVLTGVHYVFVLASLALIGQIYQLGTPTHQALLAWSLSTAPMMLLVRTPLLGFVWLAGLVWTHIATSVFYLEGLEARLGYDDVLVGNLAATIAFASTFGFLCLARVPWFVRERAAVSATWTSALWVTSVCNALALCFVFYTDLGAKEGLSWSIAVSAVLMAAFAWLLPRLYPGLMERPRLGVRILLGLTWLVFVAATSYPRDDLPAVGAIAQVLILGVTAWTVLQLGLLRLFNVLTGLIALRVLVMYFEVFGSMLSTGVGMISGGLLTLLLAWVWKRKSPEMAARFAQQGGDNHAA